jgi:hypothetical protein
MRAGVFCIGCLIFYGDFMINKTKRPWLYAAMAVAMVMWLGSCDAIVDFLEGDTDEKDSGGEDTVNIVSFDNPNILIGIGEKVRLIPTTPVTAWTSAAPDIATVDTDGTVTGVAEGTVEITAGDKQASVVVVPDDNVITVTNTDEWDSAFTTISNAEEGTAGNPAVYIFNIQGVFDVEGKTTANITGTAHKKVRLVGTGTVSLSSSGSIIRTAASQTYIFDGPTLVGMSDNNKAVVYVGGGAELRNGTVRGNTNTTGVNANGGGGVCVNSGTFEMNGGTVSGNNADYGGAGVWVNGGTFEMSGGTISGNAGTSTSGHGGGVKVLQGSFEMSGGTITGNITSGQYGGGGVWVNASGIGTFEKTGGTINGEDSNPNTITPTAGSPATTATYITNSGENGHAVALYYSSPKLFYRNGTLGPTDNLTTAGVTEDTTDPDLTAKGFEGVR